MTVIPLWWRASSPASRRLATPGRSEGSVAARCSSFVGFVSVATLFGAVTAYPLIGLLPIDAAVAESLRATVVTPAWPRSAAGAGRALGRPKWIVDLVPVNPFKAASDGAILPLIVFGLAFALALTRVAAERRVADRPLRSRSRRRDAGGGPLGAPVHALGVFALALPLAARMGVAAAAGALAYYIGLLSLISAVFIALLYPVALSWRRRVRSGSSRAPRPRARRWPSPRDRRSPPCRPASTDFAAT